MALKGDLASVDLAQVFQMLAMNQKVGLLSIQAPRSWKALYFDHRGVTLYYNEHTLLDKVLSSLVVTGALAEETVREARDHAAQTGGTVVDTILAGGFITEDQLIEAFRRAMEEEIYDLFFWRDARFEFFEEMSSFEGHEGVVNEQFFFSTDSLIMEAARRIDEWSYIRERVPGPLEVYRSTAQNAFDLEDDALVILDLADGKRNVARMVEVTGMPSFQVYKSLATLLDAGYLEAVPPGELVANARESVSEGRVQDAINLFEKAIAVGQGLPAAHSLVAHAYEALQEHELAVYHLNCEAEFHAASGNVKDAVPLLRHAIKILPTDLAARERLVELTVAHAELKVPDFEPMTEGKILVDLYLEIDEVARVRGLLERLIRASPDDLDLKKSLINVHTKAGDTRRVVELYESMANDLVQRRQPIEAVKYLQKILMIDRNRKDVSDRIRALYELDERNTSRRRNLVLLAGLFVLLAALGGGWYYYEQKAREQFTRLDVSGHLARNDFATSINLYKSFSSSFPFTMVASEAHAEVVRIEGLRAAFEAEQSNKLQERQRDLARRRSAYKAEWAKHLAEFQAQHLDAALIAIENVRRMVADAGDDDDVRWAAEIQLDKSYEELQTYLAKAAALERVAREELSAGNWQRARQHLLELVREYGMTKQAKEARLPLMIESRPPGAAVYADGTPLTVRKGDAEVPVVTPGLVACVPGGPSRFELRHEGFEPRKVEVDPLGPDHVSFVLTVVPDAVFKFSQPALHAPGLGGQHLAVGLRGGQVAILPPGNNAQPFSIKLPGLTEPLGVPTIAGGKVVFRTNEGGILCHDVDDGRLAWHLELPSAPTHDPLVRNGRLYYADGEGRLNCRSVEDGALLWEREVGPVSGPPSVAGRHVVVGTTSGSVVFLDATDGRARHSQPFPNGITTVIRIVGDVLVFGTGDANLVAVQSQDGRVLWRTTAGRVLRGEEIAVTDSAVVAVGPDQQLMRIRLNDGVIEKTFRLPARLQSGPQILRGRVFTILREGRRRAESGDVLHALDMQTFEPVWEYRDERAFQGPATSDGAAIYVTGSNGTVARFR
jgi:outer membrane protein assembly factor BamB/tetratricopeptide (TPR) repeat protein